MKLLVLFFSLFIQPGQSETVPNTHLPIPSQIPTQTASYTPVSTEVESTDTKPADPILYETAKTDISSLRTLLNQQLKLGAVTMDGIREAFTARLVEAIIPHWYGTPWSFEGHTAVPNQGEIACGYFISTTLRDMGLKLNRYKLAQKSPLDEAKMISCGSQVYTFAEQDSDKAWKNIDARTKEGIYFIGFDAGHVGYLLKREGELFLIHSNYFAPGIVCKEKLKESRVFQHFTKFHIAPITYNDDLIRRWLESRSVI